MRFFHHLALGLLLCGLGLSGCAADEFTGSDDEAEAAGGDSDGAEIAEETGTTGDSAEQALTVNGCRFHARLDRMSIRTTEQYARAKGSVSCSPEKWLDLGVCLDRYESGRWVAKQCSGRRRVKAYPAFYTSRSAGDWFGVTGLYRARIRVDNHGTAYSAAVRF
jgi:hypothetical protein